MYAPYGSKLTRKWTPYGSSGPTVEQNIPVRGIDVLPMFNPLSYSAYIPLDTIVPPSPFFQAQGSLVVRNNRGVIRQLKPNVIVAAVRPAH